MDNNKELHSRIDEFTKLPKGWDSYGGIPVTLTVAAEAKDFLGYLPHWSWQIVPGSDGSIQIEYHGHGFDIEINIADAIQPSETIVPVPTAPQLKSAEELARRFHDIYERLAPQFGYETRVDTREFDPLSKNGKLMVATCTELMSIGVADRLNLLKGLRRYNPTCQFNETEGYPEAYMFDATPGGEYVKLSDVEQILLERGITSSSEQKRGST